MAKPTGVEPATFRGTVGSSSQLSYGFKMVRRVGLEPTLSAWKAVVPPTTPAALKL